MQNDGEQKAPKCEHSDKCRYIGCKHHVNNSNNSSAMYIGIKDYEEMKDCTVWLD